MPGKRIEKDERKRYDDYNECVLRDLQIKIAKKDKLLKREKGCAVLFPY